LTLLVFISRVVTVVVAVLPFREKYVPKEAHPVVMEATEAMFGLKLTRP
jgi:hypothetical protein